MIRTEILIRAGRQHLSRSILARAVGRVRRRKYHFPIALDSSSAIQPRGPSHLSPLASVAAMRQRYHSRTRSHAPGWLCDETNGTHCRARDTHPFLLSTSTHTRERRRGGQPPFGGFATTRCVTRKQKKERKLRVTVALRRDTPRRHALTR